MKNDNRKNNGGARENAGRQKIYDDPVTLGFRIEREHRDALRLKYGRNLNTMFISWIKNLLQHK